MAESDVFSESPEELNSQECPSLQQMWTTLKRIEDNTSKLLEENKNLRASFEFSQAEIKELKESNKKLMTRIQALEKQESLTNKKLQDLEEKYDDIEQYSRIFNRNSRDTGGRGRRCWPNYLASGYQDRR